MTTNDERDAEVDRLLREALTPSRRAAASACPDAAVIAAFEEGSVSESERATLESHFADCERCQAILASLAESAPIAASRTKPEKPWLRGGHLRWLIPVIAASGLVLYLAVRPVIAPSNVFVSSAPPREPASAVASNEQAADRPAGPITGAEASKPPEEATRADEQKLTVLSPKSVTAEGGARTGGSAEFAAKRERTLASRITEEKAGAAPPGMTDRLEAERRQAANAAVAPAVQQPPVGAAVSQLAAASPQTAGQAAAAAAAADAAALKPQPQAAPEQGQARAAMAAPPAAPPAAGLGRETMVTRGADASGAVVAGAVLHKTALKEASLPIVVASPGADTLWRLEADGGISKSTDGGRGWKRQLPAGSGRWLAASAPTREVCWAGGRDGVVMVTVNGVEWRKVHLGMPLDVVAIEGVDERSATLATRDGRHFSTTDAGATWIPNR